MLLKLNVEVPDKLFITPTLEAKISVPEDAVNPPSISAETVGKIEEAVLAHTGAQVRLTLVSQPPDPEEDDPKILD